MITVSNKLPDRVHQYIKATAMISFEQFINHASAPLPSPDTLETMKELYTFAFKQGYLIALGDAFPQDTKEHPDDRH